MEAVEDMLAVMLLKAFPNGTPEQIVDGAEKFRRIIENERRSAAREERQRAVAYLGKSGYSAAAAALTRSTPDERRDEEYPGSSGNSAS